MLMSSVGRMWNCRVTAQRGMPWAPFVVSMFAASWTESPAWESFQTFRFSDFLQLAYQSIWFIWEVLLVLLRTYTGKTYMTTNPPDLVSCFFGLYSNRGCSGSRANFWAKAKQTCGNNLFLVNTFFSTKPEGVLLALLSICTSLTVWRDLRKEIWKVSQHYELLYYN